MLRSRLRGIARVLASFVAFNRNVIRWPKAYVNQLKNNIGKYGENKTFQKRVESLPKWIPLTIRIMIRTVRPAWLLAGMDFGEGLEGMYRYTVMQKVVNDLVISMMHGGYLTEKLMDEFSSYETATSNGNLTGSGRVWDFYDDAYNLFKYNTPYMSMLGVLSKFDFITTAAVKVYESELKRLDRVLRENDAFMYGGTMSNAILKGCDDVYLVSRLYRDENIPLSKLTMMQMQASAK